MVTIAREHYHARDTLHIIFYFGTISIFSNQT